MKFQVGDFVQVAETNLIGKVSAIWRPATVVTVTFDQGLGFCKNFKPEELRLLTNISEFISSPNLLTPIGVEALKFFVAVHGPSGEARRQWGYYEGYVGDPRTSIHPDYLKGYDQGSEMKKIALTFDVPD